MYKLVKQLVDAVEALDNSTDTWINTIMVILTLIAVVVSICVALNSNKYNRKVLEETRKVTLLSIQEKFPYVKIIDFEDFLEKNREICTLRDEPYNEIALYGPLYCTFGLNLSGSTRNKKPVFLFGFGLENQTDVLITKITILGIETKRYFKKKNGDSIEGYQKYIDLEKSNRNYTAAISKGQSLNYKGEFYLENEDIYKYYYDDNRMSLYLTLDIEMETIVGFKYYETIKFDGSFEETVIDYYLDDKQIRKKRKKILDTQNRKYKSK